MAASGMFAKAREDRKNLEIESKESFDSVRFRGATRNNVQSEKKGYLRNLSHSDARVKFNISTENPEKSAPENENHNAIQKNLDFEIDVASQADSIERTESISRLDSVKLSEQEGSTAAVVDESSKLDKTHPISGHEKASSSSVSENHKADQSAAAGSEQKDFDNYHPANQSVSTFSWNAPRSRLESLDCYELLEWWVGKPPHPAAAHAGAHADESSPDHERKDEARDAGRWLERYIDDWSASKADRLAADGADMAVLCSNLSALSGMVERGDGLVEMGPRYCRALIHHLGTLADAALHPPPSSAPVSVADVSLVLSLMRAGSDVAIRMEEFHRFEEAEELISLCQARAADAFRLRPAIESGDQKPSPTVAASQEADLAAVCANATSLHLLRGRPAAAESALQPALPLLARSAAASLDASAELHLIQASLLEAQGHSAAAERLARQGLSEAEALYAAELESEAKLESELADLRQQLDAGGAGRSEGLPPEGKPFYVTCSDGDVRLKSEVQHQLEENAAAKAERLGAHRARTAHRGWGVLRAIRKVGNLVKVGAAARASSRGGARAAADGPAAALRPYALRMLELEAGLGGALPVPDAVGDAAFLADYYFLCARACKRPEAGRVLLERARDACLGAVAAAKAVFGTGHAWERVAELHEKGAIALMRLGDEPERVLMLATSGVRIRRARDPAPRYLLARSLVLLSEALAYGGEMEQALEAASQGERLCALALGELHYKTRAIRAVGGDHRKAAAALFLQHHARKSPAEFVMRRLDARAWMDEWIF